MAHLSDAANTFPMKRDNRHHADPPGLWSGVLLGSLVFHLLVLVALRPLAVRVAMNSAQVDSVPIELIDVPPEEVAPEPTSSASTASPDAAENPAPTESAPTETTPSPANAAASPVEIPAVASRDRPFSQPNVQPRSPVPTPTPSPSPTPLQGSSQATPNGADSPSEPPQDTPNPTETSEPEPTSTPPADSPQADPSPNSTGDTPSPPRDTTTADGSTAPNRPQLPPVPDVPDPSFTEGSQPGDGIADSVPDVPVEEEATPASVVASLNVEELPAEGATDIPDQIAQPKTTVQSFSLDPVASRCYFTPDILPALGQPVQMKVVLETIDSQTARVYEVPELQTSGNSNYDQFADCLVRTWEFSPASTTQPLTGEVVNPPLSEVMVTITIRRDS